MRIAVYTVQQLPELIQTDFFKKSPILPISSHRAISHFHNPRAQADDQVLWLLFEQDTDTTEKLVAYRLVLPDVVYQGDQAIRMAWVSCVYVDPKCRGKGYGQQLTQLALKAWQGRLMGTEFAPASLAMYRKMGFRDFRNSEGFRGYLRLYLAILLPKRFPKLHFIKPFLWLGDMLVNGLQNTRLFFYKNTLDASISIQKSNKINGFAWDFIQSRQTHELTRRHQTELHWMLQLPWIIRPYQDKNNEAPRFHFSAFDEVFEQFCLYIFYKKKLIGVLIITHRGEQLKIPYAYFDKPQTALIAAVIKQYCLDLKIKTLTIYQPWLSEYMRHHAKPFMYHKTITRHYLYGTGFSEELKNQEAAIQDGVGDAGFT